MSFIKTLFSQLFPECELVRHSEHFSYDDLDRSDGNYSSKYWIIHLYFHKANDPRIWRGTAVSWNRRPFYLEGDAVLE
jgi:hypothetical protein